MPDLRVTAARYRRLAIELQPGSARLHLLIGPDTSAFFTFRAADDVVDVVIPGAEELRDITLSIPGVALEAIA